MEHINRHSASQSSIRTNYPTGYGNSKRTSYTKNGSRQKSGSSAQNLLQRLDAIDQKRQYKPSLYELFNQMDANAIVLFNQQ